MEVMAKVDRLHNRMLSKQRYFEDPGEKNYDCNQYFGRMRIVTLVLTVNLEYILDLGCPESPLIILLPPLQISPIGILYPS